MGAESIDLVIILNNEEAVENFKSDSAFNLGASLGLTAGPLGRDVEASIGFTLSPM